MLITSGSLTEANIVLMGESDYYRVVVASSGTLTVSTSGTLDTFGHLYDSSGNELTTNDNAGTGNNFSFSHAVTAGTYYIRARIGYRDG